MRDILRVLIVPALLLFAINVATPAQNQQPANQDGKEQKIKEMDGATMSMSSRHMEMNPHMKMTERRPTRAGDQQRADEILQTARKTLEKYSDYKAALKDGFQIFLPQVPQKMYHFTNYWYGLEAEYRFNPEHPTSLLYEKRGDSYQLVGVMYTAPAQSTEDALNDRIPLSVAQWHEHVNFCFPPPERQKEMFVPNPRFGMAGSITTKEECDKAGGKFLPRLFGWMVHIYPFEQRPEKIWAMER